jgi:hypothetical protein
MVTVARWTDMTAGIDGEVAEGTDRSTTFDHLERTFGQGAQLGDGRN